MSLDFTNYDRTQMCNHEGMLGRPLQDGTCVCLRCGRSVRSSVQVAIDRVLDARGQALHDLAEGAEPKRKP